MLSYHVVDVDGVHTSCFDLVIYMNDESTRDSLLCYEGLTTLYPLR